MFYSDDCYFLKNLLFKLNVGIRSTELNAISFYGDGKFFSAACEGRKTVDN